MIRDGASAGAPGASMLTRADSFPRYTGRVRHSSFEGLQCIPDKHKYSIAYGRALLGSEHPGHCGLILQQFSIESINDTYGFITYCKALASACEG